MFDRSSSRIILELHEPFWGTSAFVKAIVGRNFPRDDNFVFVDILISIINFFGSSGVSYEPTKR
jgi:hypothetical protein